MDATPVIDLVDASKRYGDTTALDRVDLRVASGEVVALVGPNGAGKSTLFECLLGLLTLTSGRISVLGGTPGTQRQHVGAMLQSTGLPPMMTVAELLGLVAAAHVRPLGVDDVLQRTALLGRSSTYVTDLSGGERQRLQLALAILGRPELLILDEPTASMDAPSRLSFWEHVDAAVHDGTTVLFATHDLEAARAADRVVVLVGGRVTLDGPAVDHLAGCADLGALFMPGARVASAPTRPSRFRLTEGATP